MPFFSAPSASIRAATAQIPQGIIETEILLKMRFELDQYINLRPTRLLPGVPTPLAKSSAPAISTWSSSAKTPKGLYCQNGGFLYKNTPHEVANQIEVTTRRGVERASAIAFEYAKQFGRKKVTLVAKTNVLRFAHNLWMRAFEEVKADYAGIETDYHHVDACTMYMVTKPKIYDVIVTTNMFGDIITDLGAAIQGGMGMAASGNLNPTRQAASMFEPVHGSAAGHRRQKFRQPHRDIFMRRDDAGFPESAQSRRRDQLRPARTSSPIRKITRAIWAERRQQRKWVKQSVRRSRRKQRFRIPQNADSPGRKSGFVRV